MDPKIMEIAERIRGMRQILDIGEQDMAAAIGIESETYREYEDGKHDFSFTFLYKCANKFGIDIVELLTGENPRLSFYSVVRAGQGLDVKRRAGFKYEHMAFRFKDKIAEPFLVTAPYFPDNESCDIEMSTHKGQELDYVIKGSLRVKFEEHEEVLNAGDAVYYDSGRGHGMAAVGGQECVFLAVVMREEPSK